MSPGRFTVGSLAHNQPVIQRPKAVTDGGGSLVNYIVAIYLELIFVGLTALKFKFNEALIAVLEGIVLAGHFAFGLPIIPAAGDAYVIAQELRR